MIFHKNHLLVHHTFFSENWEKMFQNLSSAAVVIGALRFY